MPSVSLPLREQRPNSKSLICLGSNSVANGEQQVGSREEKEILLLQEEGKNSKGSQEKSS